LKVRTNPNASNRNKPYSAEPEVEGEK